MARILVAVLLNTGPNKMFVTFDVTPSRGRKEYSVGGGRKKRILILKIDSRIQSRWEINAY